MPSARSRLADIEGAGLGRQLDGATIQMANLALKTALASYLLLIEAHGPQCEAAIAALADLIADATARQLREIEDGEG